MKKSSPSSAGKSTGRLGNTRLVRWLTGQPDQAPERDRLTKAAGGISGGLQSLIKTLHLGNVLEGSVFLHPVLFCLLAAALIPFLPTMALLALVMAAGLALILTYGMGRGGIGGYQPTFRWTVLLALCYLLSIFTSVAPGRSLLPGLLMAAFMLFAPAVYLSVKKYGDIRRILAAIALGGVLVSLYGFWQRLNPGDYNTGWVDKDMFSSITFRVYSTFANPNVLGEYFLLVIPFAFALGLTAPNRRKKILWIGATAMMCLCLLLTYSRGCYLGLLFGMVIFLVLLDRRFLILVGVLAVLSPLYVPDTIWQRLLSIGNLGDTSTNYRVNIWIGTMKMLKDFWFCGVGPGEDAFNTVYPLYSLSAIDTPHSHNLYLQLLCDTGLPGLLALLGFAGSLLRGLITTLHRSRRRETKIYAMAGISAFSGILLQGFTDYPFYNYRVMLLFFLLAGICMCLRREEALILAHGELGRQMNRERERPLVLQILSDTNLGGAGRYLLNLFSAWDRERYDMVLAVPKGAVLTDQVRALGVPVIEVGMDGERSMDVRGILRLRDVCMLLRPELVQTHGSLSGRIAARACGAKIIYTRHSAFPVSPRLKKGLGHLVSRWMTRHYADLCLAVSPAAEENLLELGARKDRIVTMMNGAEPLTPATLPEREALSRKYGLKKDGFTAGIFARLEEYKGQTTVLEATKLLKDRGYSLKILICGTGPMEEALEQEIRQLGLQDTAVLCGFVENVAPLLSMLDVQLNASTGTETSSLALIEGMSLGLPTIASSYGGNPYLIQDGYDGLLFAPGDASGLADCMEKLMADPDLRHTFSVHAREAYETHFTAQVFASGILNAYDRAMGKEAQQ